MHKAGRTTRHRGMMTLDVLAGIFLLAALATLLAVAINERSRSAGSLFRQRTALSAAQQALAALQQNTAPTGADADVVVSVRRTGRVVGSQEWVEVTAVCDRRSATLVGLAPRPGSQP